MKFFHYLKSITVLSFLIVTQFVALPAFAHHSQVLFDTSKVIQFKGTVHRLDWKNPHIYLIVETLNEEDEPVLIQVEGLAITQARVDGLEREALVEGTSVIVRANPNLRDSKKTVRGLNVTTLDGRVHPFYERSAKTLSLEPAEGLSGGWAPSLSETGKAFGVAAGTWKYQDAADVGQLKGVCAMEPVPFLTMINELRVIEVGEGSVVMRHDNSGDIGVRIVHLDQAEHPADFEPSLFGHSTGHWEEETLVIDTIGYFPYHSGLFDGKQSGARKHTVERLTLTEDRRQLRYEFTMEDPDYLVEPVSFSVIWDHRPDLDLSTEGCDSEISDRYLKY